MSHLAGEYIVHHFVQTMERFVTHNLGRFASKCMPVSSAATMASARPLHLKVTPRRRGARLRGNSLYLLNIYGERQPCVLWTQIYIRTIEFHDPRLLQWRTRHDIENSRVHVRGFLTSEISFHVNGYLAIKRTLRDCRALIFKGFNTLGRGWMDHMRKIREIEFETNAFRRSKFVAKRSRKLGKVSFNWRHMDWNQEVCSFICLNIPFNVGDVQLGVGANIERHVCFPL